MTESLASFSDYGSMAPPYQEMRTRSHEILILPGGLRVGDVVISKVQWTSDDNKVLLKIGDLGEVRGHSSNPDGPQASERINCVFEGTGAEGVNLHIDQVRVTNEQMPRTQKQLDQERRERLRALEVQPVRDMLRSRPTEIDYFADVEGVVAVFEFDRESMFLSHKAYSAKQAQIWCCPTLCWSCVSDALHSKDNALDEAMAPHVALTNDGIRFVVDWHKTDGNPSASKQGRISRTVPYDMITECDVEEPPGSTFVGCCCCYVPRTLTVVHCATASSVGRLRNLRPALYGNTSYDLVIPGLKDPFGFKAKVWELKRAMYKDRKASLPCSVPTSAVSLASTDIRVDGQKAAVDSGLLQPLLERNNELLVQQNGLVREQNELLSKFGAEMR